MKTDQVAAEEHNRWCLNQAVDVPRGRYGISNAESFLAGIAHARTPINNKPTKEEDERN